MQASRFSRKGSYSSKASQSVMDVLATLETDAGVALTGGRTYEQIRLLQVWEILEAAQAVCDDDALWEKIPADTRLLGADFIQNRDDLRSWLKQLLSELVDKE